MLKQLFESIPGIQIYGIVVLVLFFLLFLAIVFRVSRADKQYLKKMSELPLQATNHNGANEHD
jgi:cytochrome c oxidase cbb3-type subunit IV